METFQGSPFEFLKLRLKSRRREQRPGTYVKESARLLWTSVDFILQAHLGFGPLVVGYVVASFKCRNKMASVKHFTERGFYK